MYLLKIWKHVVIRTSLCCNQCWWKLELIWWQQLTLCIWTHLKCHTETFFIALKETFIHSCHVEVTIFVSIKYFIFQDFRLVYHVLRLNQREKSNWQDSSKSGNESWSEMNQCLFIMVICIIWLLALGNSRICKRVNPPTDEQKPRNKGHCCPPPFLESTKMCPLFKRTWPFCVMKCALWYLRIWNIRHQWTFIYCS